MLILMILELDDKVSFHHCGLQFSKSFPTLPPDFFFKTTP